jgi:hypothetical protein
MSPSRRALLVGAAGLAAMSSIGVASVLGRAGLALPRRVRWSIPAAPTTDGAGVALRRAIGGAALRDLDPFLLLDEFRSDRAGDYIRGFPDHPHRGFETVTIMLHGAMEHRDSVGNRGLLGPGSVQWMTAGRGIVHSELPQQVEGLMHGYQLWVNLPARLKMTAPRYQDLSPSAVPEVDVGDAVARVMAGSVGARRGPVDAIVTQPTLLDVRVEPRGQLELPLPAGHTAFAFLIDGEARVEGTVVPAGHLAVFGDGDGVRLKPGEGGCRLLLAAAAPIGEPIARGGPFVMNTPEEIEAAWADYRSGRLVGG